VGTGRFNPMSRKTSKPGNYLRRGFALRGFPLSWEDVQISSAAGELRLPGYAKPLRVGPVFGAAHNNFFELLPVQLSFESGKKEAPAKPKKQLPKTTAAATADQLEFRFRDDFIAGKGSLRVNRKAGRRQRFLQGCRGFWPNYKSGAGKLPVAPREASPANGITAWRTAAGAAPLTFTRAQLQAAGLNLPLKLERCPP